MKIREILQYVTLDGKTPFREWLLGLAQPETKARIRARLNRLALGNAGDFAFVGQGVFELRLHFGPGYRIYYGMDQQTIVILLMGGDKSSQKKDIQTALLYWEDYKRRKA